MFNPEHKRHQAISCHAMLFHFMSSCLIFTAGFRNTMQLGTEIAVGHIFKDSRIFCSRRNKETKKNSGLVPLAVALWFRTGINSINNKKINVRESYIIRQVMRLNSSEERGNEHQINGGPTQNCY